MAIIGCDEMMIQRLFPWQRIGKDSLNVGADGATTTVCADFPSATDRPQAGEMFTYRRVL